MRGRGEAIGSSGPHSENPAEGQVGEGEGGEGLHPPEPGSKQVVLAAQSLKSLSEEVDFRGEGAEAV